MLGRLARWLRMLGFDTAYDATLADVALVRLALDERRILLTRDRHLLRELRPMCALEVTKDAPLEQIHDIVTTLVLPPPAELFTRCLRCNTVLSPPLADAEAQQFVPPGVRGIPGPVRQCPTCGRVYWYGSHARRMRIALERGLPGWLRQR